MDLDIDHDDIQPLLEAGALRVLFYCHGSEGIPGDRPIRDHRDRATNTSTVHAEVFGIPLEGRYVRSRYMLYDGDLRRPPIIGEAVRGALAEALRTAWPQLPSDAKDEIGRIRNRTRIAAAGTRP